MELNVSFVFTVIDKHVLSLRETAIILNSLILFLKYLWQFLCGQGILIRNEITERNMCP